MAVYKIKHYSQKETEQSAKRFFRLIGDEIDENRTDLYGETAVYYSVEAPDGTAFSNDAEGNYRFTTNEININGTMYDGSLSCKYYENGKMGTINGNILQFEYEKDFKIISEADAYQMIKEGKFIFPRFNDHP